MTEYLVIYEQCENDEWSAYSPDLPGCVTAGETLDEAQGLMKEAMQMHIELMREMGAPIPAPSARAGYVAA